MEYFRSKKMASKYNKKFAAMYRMKSKSYYAQSVNFMRKSGFNLKSGMKYMNIYRQFKRREIACKNDLNKWKVNQVNVRRQAMLMMRKIRQNNLNQAKYFYRIQKQSRFIPKYSKSTFTDNGRTYVKASQMMVTAKPKSKRVDVDFVALFQKMM